MTIISTPSELITAVPFLLDAHPDNALVVIALREGAITCALRSDFPEAVTLERSDELFASLRTSDPEELLLLAYLPTPHDSQRCERLCEELQARAEEIAPVKDFLIVQSNRWRSFLCKDQRCCDPNGQQLPDIQSSAIAAEHVFQGRMMPSGLGAHAGARSDDGEVALQLLCQAQERVVASAPELRSKQGVVALLRLISSYTIQKTIDNHELAAAALVALTDIQVRDFAIGSHGDEHLHLHLSLWSDLLAIAPAGYRAPVATVLALLRYEDGDGHGARAMVERALCDDPHYSLAHLLQKTFAAGWPPEAFTTMRHELHPKLRAELLG